MGRTGIAFQGHGRQYHDVVFLLTYETSKPYHNIHVPNRFQPVQCVIYCYFKRYYYKRHLTLISIEKVRRMIVTYQLDYNYIKLARMGMNLVKITCIT